MDQADLTAKVCARPQNFAWFIGAGASATAGLPTATDVIWDMKRRHYSKEENQEITRQDVQVEAVRDRIQQYMESKGFPALWAPNEYTTYFEKIFGADKERQRRYLSALLSEDNVTLSVGSRVLAALMASGLARTVFTTNFDTVIEKAMAEVAGKSLSAFHLEGSRSAVQALNNEEFPLYCKLHGDFRHDSIKNLSQDLANQNADLSECLSRVAARFGFVVAGYSGRDESVMALFREALKTKGAFPNGLYWTGMKGGGVPASVKTLLDEATGVGIDAHFVPIETFDALMLRLWRNIENKPSQYDAKVRRTKAATVAIPLPAAGTGAPIVRLNALPLLSLPRECQALTFRNPKDWPDLRTASYNTEGNLIFTKADTVWCWGGKELLQNEFKDIVSNKVFDLASKLAELESNTLLKAFLEQALARALARGKPVLVKTDRSGSYIIADRHADDHVRFHALREVVGAPFGEIPGLFTPVTEQNPRPQKMAWAECVRVSIGIKDQKSWLLLAPNVWIWPRWSRYTAEEFLDKRRGDRFNPKHNALIDAWIDILLDPNDRSSVKLSAFENGSEAENPSFEIGTRTAYTRRSAA